MNKPTLLLVLDGWGHRDAQHGNAIASAKTPNWDKLMAHGAHALICTSGEEVGLPQGQMGNSEVGHLTLGAGRAVYQDLTRISKAIKTGVFFDNSVLKHAFAQAKQKNKAVHFLGLLSDGGVHSHQAHLFAAVKMAAEAGVSTIYCHAFLDGRDTPPHSARNYIKECLQQLKPFNAHLATLCGRYYAMDRDNRWSRVKLAYDAIANAQAPFYHTDALEALEAAYQRGESDEFVQPTSLLVDNKSVRIEDGDIVIYMNFRSDRARALSYAFAHPNFKAFAIDRPLHVGAFVTLTTYDKTLDVPVVFESEKLINNLGEVLQAHHLKQSRIAETEKYAHVTFFFNGGREAAFEGEQRFLIPSPTVATYDLAPQMSAYEVTEQLVSCILQQEFDFIVCNYANADMVGHTGNYQATLRAIEVLDECLGHIIEALKRVGGQALITADHGNAEQMLDEEGQHPHTAHTTSLVPIVYVGDANCHFQARIGTLSDVAPTLLQMMNLPIPPQMTGKPLLENN